ncbi:cohesin domain-containing protein [Microbacterium sp. SLBN-146]|uniref:cohesin domain-containing protein n=1 Tax=Microbacterium sp. SLBN-146 TaxID=2768457 RepID=UPI00114DCDA1|nr:cohesin domain-containing protein [Microbacterium sp. SLBN-146]TQJ31593.1 hypothetical protein FBY39_2072 [Microbacterium sp. SLBN-146]
MTHALARVTAAFATAFALAGASIALAPAALAAPPEIDELSVSAPESVDVGDDVEVAIAVTDATDLYAYTVTVAIDPTLFAFSEGSAVFPAGGFDAVDEGDGTITFTHTRLGTSPGLEGSQELVVFTLRAIGAGATPITVGPATFSSSTSETISLEGTIDVTTTVVEAPSPTPTPTASATAAPVDGSAAGSGSQPLAVTGQDAGVWTVVGVFAAALIAAGAVLVLRRRAVNR